MTLSGFRDQRLAQRPLYERLRLWLEVDLQTILRQLGIGAEISARTKDVASFLKKCALKGYVDPISEMPDKLGCRITTLFLDHVDPVESVICKRYEVVKKEVRGLADDRLFGYAAIHFDLRGRDGDGDFIGLPFELQLHTAGQGLWAKTSHKLAYKPVGAADHSLLRRLNRLSALLELFDQEILAARKEVVLDPAYKPAALLAHLESHYYHFTGRDFSPELSGITLEALLPLFSSGCIDSVEAELDTFVEVNRSKLSMLFADYGDDTRCSPFLFQPECIAIFFLLERDVFSLQTRWAERFPIDWLNDIGTIWGIPLDILSQ